MKSLIAVFVLVALMVNVYLTSARHSSNFASAVLEAQGKFGSPSRNEDSITREQGGVRRPVDEAYGKEPAGGPGPSRPVNKDNVKELGAGAEVDEVTCDLDLFC